MSKASLYRRNAQLALNLANSTADPHERNGYFEIARSWFDRAQKEEELPHAPPPTAAPDQPVAQQQQQQPPDKAED